MNVQATAIDRKPGTAMQITALERVMTGLTVTVTGWLYCLLSAFTRRIACRIKAAFFAGVPLLIEKIMRLRESRW